MDFKDARRILRKEKEERQTWRSATEQLDKLFEDAEAAASILDRHQAQQAQLTAAIGSLETRRAQLEASVRGFEQKLSSIKATFDAERAPLVAQLDQLRDAVRSEQEKLSQAEAGLAAFRAKHSL